MIMLAIPLMALYEISIIAARIVEPSRNPKPRSKPMALRIACLHTVDSNVAVFSAAAQGLDVSLSHSVRSDLLSRSEAAGGLTPRNP